MALFETEFSINAFDKSRKNSFALQPNPVCEERMISPRSYNLFRRRRRVVRLLLLWVLTLVHSSRACFAEFPANFTFRLWQTRDGLPENRVQAFARTSDGFLWVGTSGGLTRFDGANFEIFDQSNTPVFKESNVLCLLASRDGSLWIGLEGGGLVRMHNGGFARYSAPEGMNDAFVRTIFEDREGDIWVGTDGGLYEWKGNQKDKFEIIHAMTGSSVDAIGQDRDGRLWLGGGGLFALDHGRVHQERLEGRRDGLNVKSILEARDGSMWVGSVSGLYRQKLGSSGFSRVGGVAGGVRLLMQAVDSTLWIGTIDNGIFSMRDGAFTRLRASSSVSINSILSIFQDPDQNIWIGTQAGLLQMLRSSVHIIHLPKESESDFSTIYMDSKGVLWVASRSLFTIRNGVAKLFSLPELRGAKVRNVLRDRAKTLWFGTDGRGIFHLTRQGVVHYSVENGLANNSIRIMMQARDGALWVGTDSGMSRIAGGQVHSFGISDGLCYSTVQAIIQSADGDIWVGTLRGMSHLHSNKFQDDEVTRRLKAANVWTMNASDDGWLWIGTHNDGLYGYNGKRLMHFTTAQGLGSNSIYKLVSDYTGHLWFSGPSGISMVNLSDLYAEDDNPKTEIFPHFYYISDGQEAVQFYGGVQSGGSIDRRGEVWFPSNHGAVEIVPNNRVAPLPHLRVSHLSADGKDIPGGKSIHLSSDNSNLEIAYSAISLMPQDGLRYRYKLEGFDKNWTYAFRRRTAYYTNIPAGNYLFHVQVYNSDHPNSFYDASVIVVKRPHVYRTPWFLSCVVALLGTLLWFGYRDRVRRATAEFRAILEERSRLAREIHETILQGCASISVFLEASASAEANSQLRDELVDYARNQIGVTMDEARRAVWNLRQPDEAGADVKASIREMAERTSKEFGIRVQCNFDDSAFVIDQPTVHEVRMIAREALYNALVHSAAEKIEISTTNMAGDIAFTIRDDGNGFDPSQVSFRNHYGLTGMQERVDRLGGSFVLNTKIGEGTTVQFKIPTASRGVRENV